MPYPEFHCRSLQRREGDSRELIMIDSSRDRLMPWSGTGSWVTGHKMWPIVCSAAHTVCRLRETTL